MAPNKQRNVVELEQIGPGRYRGRFPAAQEGVYLVGMAQRRADQMVGSQLAGLVVPYGQEFRDLGVDEALLRELSEMTGGGMLSEPKQAFVQNRHRSRLTFDLWPWLVERMVLRGIATTYFQLPLSPSASSSRRRSASRAISSWGVWQRLLPPEREEVRRLGALVAVMLVPEIALRRVGSGMVTRMLGWFKGTCGSGKGGPGHDSPTAI